MKIFILSTLLVLSAHSEEKVNEIVSFLLDPKTIHTIYCHQGDSGVTTVVFPSEISGIYASGVDTKFNEKKPSPYLLSFTPGNTYFSVKSLVKENTSGALNIIHNKKVYVIHLKTASKGHSSVTFKAPQKPYAQFSAKGKSPAQPSAGLLLSMLDKAKAYHLIKKHHPARIEGLSYDAPATIMDYSTHQILLQEVIRYEEQDTLFFHIQIKNKSLSELQYHPKDFAVNAGDKIFYAALSDASGVVPPKGVTGAWFCINGTKAGGRNNLAVKNDWKVLLNVSELNKNKESKTVHKPEEKQAEIINNKAPKNDVLPTLKDLDLKEKKP